MVNNVDLHTAKKQKCDEFYTQLEDIKKELCHYTEHFFGKTILCNCDNPYKSNFFKYFVDNFDGFRLKKLIATCYRPNKHGIKLVVEHVDPYIEDISVEKLIESDKNSLTYLDGDGDFRSQECCDILKEADIVVTNPPFSLFREYVKQLLEHNKKFIIIGNVNAISYKDIVPYIVDKKIWLGYSIHGGDREFKVPKNYRLTAAGYRIDKDGNEYIRVKGVRWFTNLAYVGRPKPLVLTKTYSPSAYPKYDNYNAIEVGKTADIPKDYDGLMGVPITFLDKYCPEQFDIVGLDRYMPDNPHYGKRFIINNKETYARLLIKHKK